jgi:hypothetical protein
MDREDNSTSHADTADGDEELSFKVILCASSGDERIIARAATAQLAQAIFKAAIAEYPEQRLLLSQNGRAIADSAKK